MSPRRAASGLSLIEVMIAMVLMALVGLMAERGLSQMLRARTLPDAVRIEAAWQDNQPQRGQPRLSFAGSAPPLFRLRLRVGGRPVQLQSTPSGAVTQYTLDGHDS